MTSRSAISAALFQLLAGGYPFVTADPRMHLPEDVPGGMQPALFLVKPAEQISQSETFGAAMHRFRYYALILVYDSGATTDTAAEGQMDAILDAMEGVLSPRPGELQTLGGLVYHTWIDGDVQIDTPVFFPQAAIWLPISVLTGL